MDVLSDESDYDVISNRSLESSVDLGTSAGRGLQRGSDIREPPAFQAAREQFSTVGLRANDVQKLVGRALHRDAATASRAGTREDEERVVRVYVDGVFSPFGVGQALQLRQAKLSFPLVHLLVGVFSDSECETYGCVPSTPHIERCEIMRHCRWVDEIVQDAPWELDEGFLKKKKIDYVVLDEGASIDPAMDRVRLRGYDGLKRLGKVIPTKKTTGLTPPRLLPTPLTPTSVSLPLSETNLKDEDEDPSQHLDTYGIGY